MAIKKKKEKEERVALFPTDSKVSNSEFMKELHEKGRAVCPHCGETAREYRRRLTPELCLALIHVLKWYRHHPDAKTTLDYFHVDDLFSTLPRLKVDFSKLQYWDLIEAKGYMKKDKFVKQHGFYRISENGIKFAQREVAIPTIALVYRNVVQGHVITECKTIDSLLEQINLKYEEVIDPTTTLQYN